MTCSLAIEVADTSLRYDLGRKIGTYAAFGIPEVWVINALTLVTRVHKQLGPEGYRNVAEFGPDETMTSVRVPSVSMCLSVLGLRPVLIGRSPRPALHNKQHLATRSDTARRCDAPCGRASAGGYFCRRMHFEGD